MMKTFIVSVYVFTLMGCCATYKHTESNKSFELRILTYNIHHGEGIDKKFDLPRIAKVIAATKPDLVALQEVDNKTTRAMGIDQAKELGRLTGMNSAFGKAMDFAGGEYGEGILYKTNDALYVNIELSAPENYEPRSALALRIEPIENGPVVWFIGTHLDHLSAEVRINQCKEILNGICILNAENVILAGDLNARPDSDEIKTLKTKLTDATQGKSLKTFPSVNPRGQIDYIMFKSDKTQGRWEVIEVRVIDEKIASDHRPVLVVLRWIGNH